ELPPMPPGLEVAVAELDTQIAGLICENIGNYLALRELSEMLSDCIDTCELNLNSIQIVSDGTKEQYSLKKLPLEQKRLIYSCSFTNSVLLDLLSNLTEQSPEDIAKEIATKARIYSKPPTTAELEEFIDQLLLASESDSNWHFKRM
ncbi:MAG: hypothetical protein LH628_12190, partial [Microcoleus sp. CAN_BIN18]|nr:hypothetical protein [Microcoleus sp. CAN_BIN18]